MIAEWALRRALAEWTVGQRWTLTRPPVKAPAEPLAKVVAER
jgi:hypothetical protein